MIAEAEAKLDDGCNSQQQLPALQRRVRSRFDVLPDEAPSASLSIPKISSPGEYNSMTALSSEASLGLVKVETDLKLQRPHTTNDPFAEACEELALLDKKEHQNAMSSSSSSSSQSQSPYSLTTINVKKEYTYSYYGSVPAQNSVGGHGFEDLLQFPGDPPEKHQERIDAALLRNFEYIHRLDLIAAGLLPPEEKKGPKPPKTLFSRMNKVTSCR